MTVVIIAIIIIIVIFIRCQERSTWSGLAQCCLRNTGAGHIRSRSSTLVCSTLYFSKILYNINRRKYCCSRFFQFLKFSKRVPGCVAKDTGYRVHLWLDHLPPHNMPNPPNLQVEDITLEVGCLFSKQSLSQTHTLNAIVIV